MTLIFQNNNNIENSDIKPAVAFKKLKTEFDRFYGLENDKDQKLKLHQTALTSLSEDENPGFQI